MLISRDRTSIAFVRINATQPVAQTSRTHRDLFADVRELSAEAKNAGMVPNLRALTVFAHRVKLKNAGMENQETVMIARVLYAAQRKIRFAGMAQNALVFANAHHVEVHAGTVMNLILKITASVLCALMIYVGTARADQ